MNAKFRLFDDNKTMFDAAINDILQAKETICLEIYRFGQDSMGKKFSDALIQKAKEGVNIKLLVDAWGTGQNETFFEPLIKAGVQFRIYHKLIWDRGYLSKNHCRNHRKLLIIDSNVAYIGSSNITTYSLPWRELNLRIEDTGLTAILTRSFKNSYRIYNRYSFRKGKGKRDVKYGDWLFVQDLPSPYRQNIKGKYEQMIDKATREVIIETPYFLPGYRLRKKLGEAAQRGVRVVIITPFHSDVHAVDIIRRHYSGILHKSGVELQFYSPGNLHAKCVMIDNAVFSISSANFDYRSFRYQYELALMGRDTDVLKLLRQHIDLSLDCCQPFNYKTWKSRSPIERLIERLLLPFRHLF
ncbi:MAG: phosphatidylserine/phosphatidylglycerophosphate/cardiolipin synthase family protein [Bacteroidales bacterium]|jgi:cardiolipin synthase|nr:phosphatidylserine/phosphatidylglycerophosphate/cardiolipin synthase family protein [Bacteroidales bacterium]